MNDERKDQRRTDSAEGGGSGTEWYTDLHDCAAMLENEIVYERNLLASPDGGGSRIALGRNERWLAAVRRAIAFIERGGTVNEKLTVAPLTDSQREALEFYANSDSYCQLTIPGVPYSDPRTFAPVLQDGGAKARSLLDQLANGVGGDA
jgi:hypothetical protein